MEQQNQKHLGLMWLGCTGDKPKLDLLQEEEKEEDHHLPLQNALEEQILMIIQHPASLVKAAGIGDTDGQKGDWHQQD